MIGRKLKPKKHTESTATELNEEQQKFVKEHRFTSPQTKQDSQFNPPGPDGLYSLLPRQQSNMGVYQCCMEKDHTFDGMHNKDPATGLTRFWCKICGWDLSLRQSDDYMTARMNQNE